MANDTILRFVFDETDVRGEIVQMKVSYQETLARHNYPSAVKNLLGEFLAASALLSANLKFEGSVILQAKSDAAIATIMAECSNDFRVRAIVRGADENLVDHDFAALLGNGTLAITIDPTKGKRYQGIVGLDANCLADALGEYFISSEQLNTRFWLASDGEQCSGIMLQELPDDKGKRRDQRIIDWEHLTQIGATITPIEMLSLDHNEILYRLYHQDKVRILQERDVRFGCSCSQKRTAAAIQSIGYTEADSILAEQGVIAIRCEFCNHEYTFDRAAIDELFSDNQPNLH